MKSKVFFVPVEDAEDIDAVNGKLDLLLAEKPSPLRCRSRPESGCEATFRLRRALTLSSGPIICDSYVTRLPKRAPSPFFQMPIRFIAANGSIRKIILHHPGFQNGSGGRIFIPV